jgi:hypothetical protein
MGADWISVLAGLILGVVRQAPLSTDMTVGRVERAIAAAGRSPGAERQPKALAAARR